MTGYERMLTEAFCFESQSIEPVQLAYRHKDDHFFCPEDICLVEVTPVKRKNYFFRALKGKLHHINCRYFKEPRDGDGTGDPVQKPSPTPKPLIPTRLGPPAPPLEWKQPTREELLDMVLDARRQPTQVPGTLEDVISAWQFIEPTLRVATPLLIEGSQLNYRDAFVFLATAGDHVADLPWGERIIFGAADLVNGRVDGFIFVTSVRKLLCGEERLPLKHTIRPEYYAEGTGRNYICDIPSPSRGTLFWLGEPPVLTDDRRHLQLTLPINTCFRGSALRPGILSP